MLVRHFSRNNSLVDFDRVCDLLAKYFAFNGATNVSRTGHWSWIFEIADPFISKMNLRTNNCCNWIIWSYWFYKVSLSAKNSLKANLAWFFLWLKENEIIYRTLKPRDGKNWLNWALKSPRAELTAERLLNSGKSLSKYNSYCQSVSSLHSGC